MDQAIGKYASCDGTTSSAMAPSTSSWKKPVKPIRDCYCPPTSLLSLLFSFLPRSSPTSHYRLALPWQWDPLHKWLQSITPCIISHCGGSAAQIEMKVTKWLVICHNLDTFCIERCTNDKFGVMATWPGRDQPVSGPCVSSQHTSQMIYLAVNCLLGGI